MIRALLSLGSNSKRRRVARRRPSEPERLSRRDFLAFGRSPRRAAGTWRVTIDADVCTDCSACTRICEEDALRRSEGDLHVVYSLDLASCTGCRDCEVICAAKAVSLLCDAEIGRGVIEIVSLPKGRCSGCGQTRAGLANRRCSVCRSTRMLETLRR
jgi:Pyruvate/2-oxoacid:ferredoxin oxidoreductase delta subunit